MNVILYKNDYIVVSGKWNESDHDMKLYCKRIHCNKNSPLLMTSKPFNI